MLSKACVGALSAVFLVGCSRQPVQPATELRPSAVSAATSPQEAAATGMPDPSRDVTIPAGTRLRVRLAETLDAKYCRPGQRFAATLDTPITVGDRVVVPHGSMVRGHITSARQSGRLKGRAVLGLELDSVEVNGASYPLDTNISARASTSHKKRNLAIIGGSSGGGAIIGGVAGGGVGALIGAAAGAGAGTAGAYFTGRKDIVLRAETELSFNLAEPVTLRQ